MELWELQADEPISDLREYLSKQDLRELALLIHELVKRARGSEFLGEAIDECVDALLERYGSRNLASLLPEVGLSRDDIVEDLRALLPALIEAAKADGRLDALVRARLEPFYKSKKVQTILAGTPRAG
jgi:hypothetical protein